jgi:hypothetical protein
MSRVFVLLWLAALLAVTVANRRPFRSATAPAETVERYSVVLPQVVEKDPGEEVSPQN